MNRDDSDSRSRKSSGTSLRAGAAATASPEEYLRKHLLAIAAVGRASRNASRRREDDISRKAIVSCGSADDQPKLSLLFPAGIKM